MYHSIRETLNLADKLVCWLSERYAKTIYKIAFNQIFQKFKCVSFDNLAIEQLDVKRLMSEDEWQTFYMGDDGSFTFYIDMVEGTFGKNSLTPKNKRIPIGEKTINEMFELVRNNNWD